MRNYIMVRMECTNETIQREDGSETAIFQIGEETPNEYEITMDQFVPIRNTILVEVGAERQYAKGFAHLKSGEIYCTQRQLFGLFG